MPSSSFFQAALTVHHTTASVQLTGELDMGTANRLRAVVPRVLLRGNLEEVHLDLRELTFCDSSGAHELFVAYSRWRLAGLNVNIRGVRPSLRNLFELTGWPPLSLR